MGDVLNFINENSGALTLLILAVVGWNTNEIRHLGRRLENIDRFILGRGRK